MKKIIAPAMLLFAMIAINTVSAQDAAPKKPKAPPPAPKYVSTKCIAPKIVKNEEVKAPPAPKVKPAKPKVAPPPPPPAPPKVKKAAKPKLEAVKPAPVKE